MTPFLNGQSIWLGLEAVALTTATSSSQLHQVTKCCPKKISLSQEFFCISNSKSFSFYFLSPGDQTNTVRRIIAPKSGTKWHNPSQSVNVWFEAISDDGNHYYWNTETNGKLD